MRKFWSYILVYLLWIVVLALGLWFILVGRNSLLAASEVFYVGGDPVTHAWRGSLYDKAYSITVGLLWLALSTVTEPYFRQGLRRRQLWRRFAHIAGPELLLIFAADLSLLWLQGWSTTWLRWVILGAELIVGLALLGFARFPRASGRDGVLPDEASDATYRSDFARGL